MPLLTATGIWKSYSGVAALRNVNFALNSGETHALIGENGAGKSTLIKIITGAITAEKGTVSIGGNVVTAATPGLMKKLGVAAIYQQPSLFGQLSVAENIALAVEHRRAWGRIDWRWRNQQARQLLDRIGADIDVSREAASLTMPEQQLVEIAKAVGTEAKIFVMDEPTSALTAKEVDNLFRVIAELRGRGAGIIYISHRLEELPRIADRISVLRDGEAIATRHMKDVDRDELVRLMVGRNVSAIFPKKIVPIGETVLRLRGVNGVDLDIRAGEIVGLAGLAGSGRTELADTIFGLTPATSGTIELRGTPVVIDSPHAAIAAGIGYVPEDRRQHGLVQEMTVTENTTLASLPAGILDFAGERATANEFVTKLGTKTSSINAPVATLSGGNQQKVVLSRWLSKKPVLMILDEPTQGIDIGAKSEVHSLMGDLAAQGMAILMISSELAEVLGMSDRIAVMSEGRIAGILNRPDATQEAILTLGLPKQSGAAK